MLKPSPLSLQAILLSSDGHNLVTGGDNGVVEVWQACDFKQLYIYPGCDAGIRAMDLSHDQRSAQAEMMYCIQTRDLQWELQQSVKLTLFYLPIHFAIIVITSLMRDKNRRGVSKINLVSVEGWVHACRSPLPHMSMWSRNADVFYVRGFGDYLNATDVLHFSLLINLLPLFF